MAEKQLYKRLAFLRPLLILAGCLLVFGVSGMTSPLSCEKLFGKKVSIQTLQLIQEMNAALSSADQAAIVGVLARADQLAWDQNNRKNGEHNDFFPFIETFFLNPEIRGESFERLQSLLNHQIQSDEFRDGFAERRRQVLQLIQQRFLKLVETLSPQSLLKFHLLLGSLKKMTDISAQAVLLQIQIRERIEAMQNSSDPTLAKEARDVYDGGSFDFDRVSLAEQRVVKAILERIVSEKFAKKEISLEVAGQHVRVTQQDEFERRIRLRLPKEIFFKLPMRGSHSGQTVNVNNVETVVRLILDKFYHERQSGRTSLSVRPLGDINSHFHSDDLLESRSTDLAGDEGFKRFTTEVSSILALGTENDRISQDYIVSFQKEVATYFDTSDLALVNADLALRKKEWHPVGQSLESPAAAIFVKKTEKVQGGLFTHRQEFQANLPNHDSKFELEAMRKLLEHLGVANANKLPIEPVVRIDNERYGFDLVWRKGVKIGFFVIDTFHRKVLNPERDRGVLGEDGTHTQWEVEILPEWRELYETQKSEFEAFFNELEKQFGGELNPTPKMLER